MEVHILKPLSRLYHEEVLYRVASNTDSSAEPWLPTRPVGLPNLTTLRPETEQSTHSRRDFQTGPRPLPPGFTISPLLIHTRSPQLARETTRPSQHKVWAQWGPVPHTSQTDRIHTYSSLPPALLSQRSKHPSPHKPCFYSASCLLQDLIDIFFNLSRLHFTDSYPTAHRYIWVPNSQTIVSSYQLVSFPLLPSFLKEDPILALYPSPCSHLCLLQSSQLNSISCEGPDDMLSKSIFSCP